MGIVHSLAAVAEANGEEEQGMKTADIVLVGLAMQVTQIAGEIFVSKVLREIGSGGFLRCVHTIVLFYFQTHSLAGLRTLDGVPAGVVIVTDAIGTLEIIADVVVLPVEQQRLDADLSKVVPSIAIGLHVLYKRLRKDTRIIPLVVLGGIVAVC